MCISAACVITWCFNTSIWGKSILQHRMYCLFDLYRSREGCSFSDAHIRLHTVLLRTGSLPPPSCFETEPVNLSAQAAPVGLRSLMFTGWQLLHAAADHAGGLGGQRYLPL